MLIKFIFWDNFTVKRDLTFFVRLVRLSEIRLCFIVCGHVGQLIKST